VTAQEIIKLLELQPLPMEGGYFAVTHTSDERLSSTCLPQRYQHSRDLSGAIYYLETPEQFSAMHRLPTDEIYYFHLGDPLELLLLAPDGSGERIILGPDLKAGQKLQQLAPRNYWQGSRPSPGGSHGFSLVSTSMAPGYAEGDAEFASAEELIKSYPSNTNLIQSLTRY
jgi:predicted cupin superfamily sugar epimerase